MEEGRFNPTLGKSSKGDQAHDVLFHKLMKVRTEAFQPGFTRKGVIGSGAASLARLDRCFIQLPHAVLNDLYPASWNAQTLFAADADEISAAKVILLSKLIEFNVVKLVQETHGNEFNMDSAHMVNILRIWILDGSFCSTSGGGIWGAGFLAACTQVQQHAVSSCGAWAS